MKANSLVKLTIYSKNPEMDPVKFIMRDGSLLFSADILEQGYKKKITENKVKLEYLNKQYSILNVFRLDIPNSFTRVEG